MVQKESINSSSTVLIAHPYSLIRDGLCHIISEAGFEVCNQVGDIEALFTAVSERNPDLILVDFRLFKNDISLVDKLKNMTSAAVTIVAVPEEIETAPDALKAGARGYLSYSQTPEDFMQSLSLLTKGSVIVSSIASRKIQSSIHENKLISDYITEREKEVVVLVALGATNREIADKLMVSQHTVKIHLHNILNKLDLRNRQQIAAYAIQQGYVEDIKSEDFA